MRLATMLGFAILGLTLMVGVGATQDTKKEKAKGFLPQGWKDLDLSADQKDKAYKILTDYKLKINDLNDSIKKLKTEEKGELAKILTEPQKEKLKASVVGETTKKKTEEKKSEDKK